MTPSMLRSCAASGEGWGGASVERGLRYSRKGEDIDSGRTRWLGLNLRACGYVNIVLVFSVVERIHRRLVLAQFG